MLPVDLVHSLGVLQARCEISFIMLWIWGSCNLISFVGNLDVYRYSLTISRMEKFLKISLSGIKMCFKIGVICNQIKKSSGSSFFCTSVLGVCGREQGGNRVCSQYKFVICRQPKIIPMVLCGRQLMSNWGMVCRKGPMVSPRKCFHLILLQLTCLWKQPTSPPPLWTWRPINFLLQILASLCWGEWLCWLETIGHPA